MLYQIRKFIDSTNFTNAIKVTLAAVIPFLALANLGYFNIGFTVALGAILAFPSDIHGNLKHKINGLLVAVLLAAGCTLLISACSSHPWILYPVMAFSLFFLSMLSAYGQRANLVSFSGLIAIALAFSHDYKGWDLIVHSTWIAAGGLFYILISLLFYFIRPKRYVELLTVDCIRLTSKYLKLRGDLWNIDANKSKIIEKQLHLQVEINTIHENLREFLIGAQSSSSNSNHNRKMLIVFTTMVDILELALSTSFDYDKLHKKFAAHQKVLATYQNLAYNLAASLKKIAKSIENGSKYTSRHSLQEDLEALERVIANYEKTLGKENAYEGVLMLTNMLHYAERQIEKIKTLERVFSGSININLQDYKNRNKDIEKFLTPQNYRWNTLVENLSFSSTFFRHALRMTITLLLGYIIGRFLPFQNVYWILLTIVVIMRPGYGLTKQRSIERILGTVIGGVIAFGFLYITNNHTALGVLSIISMLLGFTFSNTNYKIGATFVTMYVIFIYGILTPNVNEVIQYRILDTLVGAVLSFTASYLLWPSWEFLNVRTFLEKAIAANRDYLKEIAVFYNQKGEVTTSYKLARKHAFIEIGNLMASFQRMIQEPKSKQRQKSQVFKLAVLNHTLLSSLASIGTYVQSHKTTKASEAFNIVVNTVVRNLDQAIAILNNKKDIVSLTEDEKKRLEISFSELKSIRARELHEAVTDDEDFRLQLEESQLVIEQLIWLTNLSENILKAIITLKQQ
ncbi:MULTISPECIES: FUSC family membrane protein [Flavobacterium]|uniref:FUSC family membrane protein n=2 Tax=Flavobacteriaceae TaxID=49546 RepID=UPI0015A8D24D|nr:MULTISPECIES: FUSC family membrane protein [Flavobacterium]